MDAKTCRTLLYQDNNAFSIRIHSFLTILHSIISLNTGYYHYLYYSIILLLFLFIN